MLKIGVTEIAPLTFRALTLPFAAMGMLLVARWSGGSHPHAARHGGAAWPCSRFFNITGWNGFVLFGVQQLPAGRSAILAYTMPIWATLIAIVVLHEPLDGARSSAWCWACSGMALLLGDDIRHIRVGAGRRVADPGRRDPVGARHGASAQVEAADRRRTRCPAG